MAAADIPSQGVSDKDQSSMEDVKGTGDSQIENAPPNPEDGLMSELDTLSVWDSILKFRTASIYCMIAAFSATMDGYQINLTGSIIANKGFIQQFSRPGTTALNTNDVAGWGGIQSGGQVLGMLTLNYLSDFAGRKIAMYLIVVMLAGGTFAETFATTPAHWYAAKLLGGIAVGMLQSTMPVYITEISPAQIRGALVNAYSLWFVFGQFLAPLVLQRMNADQPYSFRTPIYTEWIMVGLILICFLVIPESPWWLISKGKMERARKVLAHIHHEVKEYNVDHEMHIIQNVISKERILASELKQESSLTIFRGTNLRRTFISCWPKCMQQLTGLTLVNTYATYFFQLAGNQDPFLVTVILVVIQIVSVLVISIFSDSYGRRGPVVYGFAIAAVSVLCIGIVGCFNYTSSSIGSLLIFFAALVMFFNTASGALGYAYLAEVPQQRWRARTAGFGAACGAALGTCFSTAVPYMLKTNPGVGWGVRTGFFFGATGIPAVVLAWFILPETARRTPGEMDELFDKRVPARRFAGYVTDAQRTVEAEQHPENV